jgi:hypothetical protein
LSLLVEEYYPEKGYSSNCLTLAADLLEIKHNNHRYLLPLAQIEDIQLSHVRLLFYYLIGGFTLALTLIAVLSNFLAPLPGILLILAGATSLYIGLKGKISLQISTTTDDYVFWFSGKYQPFLQFINVVRHRVITHQSFESSQPPAPFE